MILGRLRTSLLLVAAATRLDAQLPPYRDASKPFEIRIRDLVGRMTLDEKFRRLTLKPCEEKEISFTIGPEQLRMLDKNMRWIVEPGAFRVLIGSSSKDIRLRFDFNVE